MAYDYSLQYLANHQTTVQRLEQIATSGEVLMYEAEGSHEIRNRQKLIRNLLASMARNISGMENINEVLRCWTEYRQEKYRLYVGRPPIKLPGKVGSKIYDWTQALSGYATTGVHNHSEQITDQDSYTRFVGTVMNLPTSVGTVSVKVVDLGPEAVEHFTDVFGGHGWSASADDKTLTLTRTK